LKNKRWKLIQSLTLTADSAILIFSWLVIRKTNLENGIFLLRQRNVIIVDGGRLLLIVENAEKFIIAAKNARNCNGNFIKTNANEKIIGRLYSYYKSDSEDNQSLWNMLSDESPAKLSLQLL
jgi:hypothetical protein